MCEIKYLKFLILSQLVIVILEIKHVNSVKESTHLSKPEGFKPNVHTKNIPISKTKFKKAGDLEQQKIGYIHLYPAKQEGPFRIYNGNTQAEPEGPFRIYNGGNANSYMAEKRQKELDLFKNFGLVDSANQNDASGYTLWDVVNGAKKI